MNTSQKMSFSSNIEKQGGVFGPANRAYLQERALYNIHEYIVTKFLEKEAAGELTKAELARRTGKKPEVISRLLGSPRNLTVTTMSDLLLGIAEEEVQLTSRPLKNRVPRNANADEILRSPAIVITPTGSNTSRTGDKKPQPMNSAPQRSIVFEPA